ncbi:hypothetical protein F4820DRAFT_221164 [Hypoxylon rubiginosum]|uniref:Uncharacterized protein n=1 Tax=Hypoxylon rubiginosum TaxID=110542 RepID=A0ACB9ZH73_9PEZI|nr:hypothetical protein F4820DRAFT_221164 [Hypoxylon rubiginosum]
MYVSYPVLDYVSLLLLSYPFRYVDPPALHYPGQSYRLCMACLTLSCLVWSCLALPHLALALGGIMIPCLLPSYGTAKKLRWRGTNNNVWTLETLGGLGGICTYCQNSLNFHSLPAQPQRQHPQHLQLPSRQQPLLHRPTFAPTPTSTPV